MSQPQSPFDDDVEPLHAQVQSTGKPARMERKWSFVALSVVLFILVWVREFLQLSPEATITTAVSILVVWLVVHVSLFTELPEVHAAPRLAGRPGSELSQPRPTAAHIPRFRASGVVGILVGIWMQALLPLSPVELSVVVVVLMLVLYWSQMTASRR